MRSRCATIRRRAPTPGLGKIASDVAWRRVEPFEGVDAAHIRYLTIAEAKRLINAVTLARFRPYMF
jgi:hypothetical protein